MTENDESTRLGYYLNRTFTALVEELNRDLHRAGIPLNHSQFVILKALLKSESEVMSQREIAARVGKDPAAISRTLASLERSGFVERHPVSGCKNGVALTPKAIALHSEIEKVIQTTVLTACSGISPEEYSTGISFLNKIYETLHIRHTPTPCPPN